MNKRLVTLLTVGLVIVIAAIVGLYYIYNQPKVQQISFDLKSGVAAKIYKIDPNSGETARDATVSIDRSTTVPLEASKYVVIPSGKDIDTTPIIVVVADRDMTVAIKPGFSKEYLEKLVAAEKTKVDALLVSSYPQIATDFTINAGALYQNGEWYSTTLTQNAKRGNNGDVYHVVLHKQNNEWQIVGKPQIVLTKANSPNVPEDVLKTANSQES